MKWWTKSWNPVIGCTKCSPACDNCYAETLHTQRHKAKLAGADMPLYYAEPFDRVRFLPERLEQPLHWRKPQRIFVGNMGDLFHEGVKDELLDRIFAVMALCPQHTFMLLTKRPERMREYMHELFQDEMHERKDRMTPAVNAVLLSAGKTWGQCGSTSTAITTMSRRAGLREPRMYRCTPDGGVEVYGNCGKGWKWWPISKEVADAVRPHAWPVGETAGWGLKELPPNVWLGTTIWDQASLERNLPFLLSTPAAKRFVSVEPMLGAVDLGRWVRPIAMMQPDMAPSTWEEWDAKQLWPAWVPPKWRTLIEEFWGADSRRSPRSWLSDAIQQRAAPHGEVFHGMALDGGRVEGRFLHTWNNMCVLVDANGEAHVSSTPFNHVGESYLALDWVICGGETGAKARPIHPDWPRSLRDQCISAGVPFFFKQWGEYHHQGRAGIVEARGSDMPNAAWPDGTVGEGKAENRGGAGTLLSRVGTRKAGRVLDGRTWEEVPNAHS